MRLCKLGEKKSHRILNIKRKRFWEKNLKKWSFKKVLATDWWKKLGQVAGWWTMQLVECDVTTLSMTYRRELASSTIDTKKSFKKSKSFFGTYVMTWKQNFVLFQVKDYDFMQMKLIMWPLIFTSPSSFSFFTWKIEII